VSPLCGPPLFSSEVWKGLFHFACHKLLYILSLVAIRGGAVRSANVDREARTSDRNMRCKFTVKEQGNRSS